MEGINKFVNATTVIVFIVAFLLGYGTSSRLVSRDKGLEAVTQETSQQGEYKAPQVASPTVSPVSSVADVSAAIGGGKMNESQEDAGGMVSADDQAAGSTVSVSVNASKPVWVVVHEDSEGAPGSILGAQLFATGSHEGVVDLLRGTEIGQEYYVMLHSDDGDRKFDYKKDLPVKDATGAVIMHGFMAN